jgi:hypothetical protein
MSVNGRFLEGLVRQGRLDRSVMLAERADGARLDVCRFVGASHPQIERQIEQRVLIHMIRECCRILQNLAVLATVFTARSGA